MTEQSAEKTTESTNGNGATEKPETNPLTELEAQLKEEKNKYLYLYADFDNYKKRMIKERSDLIKFGAESFAREMINVMDNLERAVEHMPATTDASFKQGIEMTLNQFKQSLEKQGVRDVKTNGENFNPELHEAMGQEPSDKAEGTITQTLVKGYTLHGRLLRPARVVVSAGQKTGT